MKKMQVMDNIDKEQAIESAVLAEGESESVVRQQINHNIKDSIVNMVNTL